MSTPKWDETEEIAPRWDDTEEIAPISEVQSIARAVPQGISAGTADEYTGAIDAATKGTLVDNIAGLSKYMPSTAPAAVIAGAGEKLYDVATTDKTLKDAITEMLGDYKSSRDESRKANKAAKDANPNSYMAAETGASLLTGGLGMAKAGSTLARSGISGAQGAVSGFGTSEADNAVDLAQDTGLGFILGSAFQAGGEKVLSPIINAGANAAGKGASVVSQKIRPLADKYLPKIARVATGADEDAMRRQFQRPLQTAAAEDDDFVLNVGREAVKETTLKGQRLGKAVGLEEKKVLKEFGGEEVDDAQTIADSIFGFLDEHKPSRLGFSGVSEKQAEELRQIAEDISERGATVEDMVKLRKYMDHVEGLAKKYDVEGTTPYVRMLKSIRGQSDKFLDDNFEDFDKANKAFSQFADDKAMLPITDNRAESMIGNLYGRNKGAQQEAASRLFSGQTMEKAKDVAANKAVGGAMGPAGSEFGIRRMLSAGAAVGTLGASLPVTSPEAWKTGVRATSRLMTTIQRNPQALGRFAQSLTDAASRGPQAFAATHFILSQKHQEYRDMTKQLETEEDDK